MKRLLLAALTALMITSVAPRAEAKIFEVWGSGLLGTSFGNGKTGKDFFSWVGGGAAGAEVGVKLLFLGAYIDYLRFFGGDAGANLVSFNLGGDGTVNFGPLALVFRLAGAFYIGTLPDDVTILRDGVAIKGNNVHTRGIGVRGGLGLRYTFLKIFSVGCTPQVGYHYFFGGADEDPRNENSHGWDFQALGYFRVGLGF
ncbi:MAG: hypothetical protein IT371_17720 [Deltaproteobacteria bacterium]|nr:hypothetical protein [Deltaproteobacteria bacterium]